MYIAGKEATIALELFLSQKLGFAHDEGSIWQLACHGKEAQLAIMARLAKLTAQSAGAKPDWALGRGMKLSPSYACSGDGRAAVARRHTRACSCLYLDPELT